MPNANDQNSQLFVERFVDDAIPPHPKSAQAPEFPLQRGACGRFLSESVDRRDEPRSLPCVDSLQSLDSATLDLDRVAHP